MHKLTLGLGAVLSNVLCQRTAVQHVVHSLGGAELLLEQCQVWLVAQCGSASADLGSDGIQLQMHGSCLKSFTSLSAGADVQLLCCTQVDEDSPLSREWALWGMRNLCEGNIAVQQDLGKLRAHTIVDSEELRQAGIRLQIDHATGKVQTLKSCRRNLLVGEASPD